MKEQIIKEIERMSGTYSAYEIFSDWIKLSAIAISNGTDLIHGDIWKKREDNYLEIVRKHGEGAAEKFCHMLGMLAIALEENIEDVLGDVYMRAGLGSKNTGQFFTPFHLSLLTAKLTIPGDISENHPLILNEPSVGGVGMIIAAARTLKDRGLNFQKCMDVTAQDLDWKGVYMTYVQLSLLGIKATVAQGDTLAEPFIPGIHPGGRVLYTPARKGLLL